MKNISIADSTLRKNDSELSFKEKIDIACILDNLNVPVIEVHGIQQKQTDSLLLKSIASAVKQSILAVPVDLNEESVRNTVAALSEARAFRLQIPVPVSSVQMEYVCHKKPDAILALMASLIESCKKYTDNIEFLALDATRAEKEFLSQAITTAYNGGVSQITLCDDAATFLPQELFTFIDELKSGNPVLNKIPTGIRCNNSLHLADACTLASLNHNIDEIKTMAYGNSTASLASIATILYAKGDIYGVTCSIQKTKLQHSIEQIEDIFTSKPHRNAICHYHPQEETYTIKELSADDDLSTLITAVKQLGYDLSEEDYHNVYKAFRSIAEKKNVGIKELEAIVAANALDVPPTYVLENYVINSGNIITATANIKVRKGDNILEGISVGDGPIDAAFLALEKILGHHYELDDFQIRSVTEGREAMGEAIVKLRSFGKLYSGRGISTDIVGSSILAYLNALNKIVFEED